MVKVRRPANHFRLFIVTLLTTGMVTLTGCVTISPPSTPSPEVLPKASPTPQEPSQDYVERQWTLQNRTANLSTSIEEGSTQRIEYKFDKPVDVWFEHLDYVVISIGGAPPQHPPHTTNTHDASGEPLYYFMAGVTSFSYTVTAVQGKDIARYMLHIRPPEDGSVVTITCRIYG